MFFKFLFTLFVYVLYAVVGRGCTTAKAQIINGQDLLISDNSVFFIGSGSFNMGTGSIVTSRKIGENGLLSFSADAIYAGEDNTHFIDGYVQTLCQLPFILPIGHSNFYAPVQVSSMSTAGVDAAYFRKPPEDIGNKLDSVVTAISMFEYWDINSSGSATEIALSWRISGDIADLTQFSLDVLSIIGFDGLSWVPIPSTVDKYSILGELSSLKSGSIRSDTALDLNKYSAFTLDRISQSEAYVETKPVRVVAGTNKNRLFIHSLLPVKSFVVYDLMGKKILVQRVNGANKIDQPFNYEKSVYIVKIQLSNGSAVFTRKIIN